MACKPLVIQPGLFVNANEGLWNFVDESGSAGRSVSYSASTLTNSGYWSGDLTISGPNGSILVPGRTNHILGHRFFGGGMFLAVLERNTPMGGPGHRILSIVDFTAPMIQLRQVFFLSADPLAGVYLQPSQGNGAVCLVWANVTYGVAYLAIHRSDSGALILRGPSPYNSNSVLGAIHGEATNTSVQIKQNLTVIAGPQALPTGKLSVSPVQQNFPEVPIGGCTVPPVTKTFTLTNTGTDCIEVQAIANAAPYSVSGTSLPLPADLAPGASLTATVRFNPSNPGSFNNVALAITRTPANGDDKLICSGRGETARPAYSVLPATLDFGHVLVGTTKGPSTFTVTNSGQLPINVSVPGPPQGSPFSWMGFNGTLTCGQSQPIAVSFSPNAAWPLTQTITITSVPGGVKVVTLVGEGCDPKAVIQLPPAPFPGFGKVRRGYRMVRFITVKNTGDGPLDFTASLTGPDAALFGIMKPSNSITDVVASRAFRSILPKVPCIGPAGSGEVELAVVFYADSAHGIGPANATLTIDRHNDPATQQSFTFTLNAEIEVGNVVDVVAVFDRSGSMDETVTGGNRKVDLAVEAGKLLAQLVPPNLGNRLGLTRFDDAADNYSNMAEVTTGNQSSLVQNVNVTDLQPRGATAIAAGVMTALKQYAVQRNGPAPTLLTKTMIVLSDGEENMAFPNPLDGKYYSILPGLYRIPTGGLANTVRFNPPPDVRIFAVGIGTEQSTAKQQLTALSSSTNGRYLVADSTSPNIRFQLMKHYTQIYMNMVDFAQIVDPDFTIWPGQTQTFEFDLLRGDVGAMIVLYDLDGIRLPFFAISPRGEVLDANYVPPGFQLRSGFTDRSRFLDFLLPPSEPDRYAGRWKVIVKHDGRACRGMPVNRKRGKDKGLLGFLPSDCGNTSDPINYGIAIGAGSNFRLQPYVTAAPVKVGDPILLTGVITEAGLQTPGCTVTVEARSPSGQVWSLNLLDDGQHQDGEAEDGEYARLFTRTQEAGSYTFTFRAKGLSRDREAVSREAVLSKYVEGWIGQPPSGGDPGGLDGGDPKRNDDCCEKLVKLLEEQLRVIRQSTKTGPPEVRRKLK
jgi:hypothetical protein